MTVYLVLRDLWDDEFGYHASQFMGIFATSEQATELVDHHINEAVKKAHAEGEDDCFCIKEGSHADEEHEKFKEYYFMDSDGFEHGARFRIIETEAEVIGE